MAKGSVFTTCRAHAYCVLERLDGHEFHHRVGIQQPLNAAPMMRTEAFRVSTPLPRARRRRRARNPFRPWWKFWRKH
jgi:hypothetical protein